MFCTNCGASNKNGANLCINCGESLRTNQIEDRLSRLRGLDDVPSSNKFGFLHPLIDFSFHRSITVKMMKFLYILSILGAGLMAFFLILLGFETSLGFGLFALLMGAPVVFLLTVIFSRVFLEMILVVFRIADRKADRGVANVKEKAEPREGIQWNV
jgi:hypothetical protein